MHERIYCEEQVDALPYDAPLTAVYIFETLDLGYDMDTQGYSLGDLGDPGLYFYLCGSKYNYLVLGESSGE